MTFMTYDELIGDIVSCADEIDGGKREARALCQELYDRLMAERNEARYAARLLEHAYQHNSRPSAEALQIVRAWGSWRPAPNREAP